MVRLLASFSLRLAVVLAVAVVLAEIAEEGFELVWPETSPFVSQGIHILFVAAAVGVLVETGVVRRLRRALAQQQEAESRYRLLFDESPVLCCLTRHDTGRPVVADANRAFCHAVGLDRSQVVGQFLDRFYDERSRRELLDRGGYQRALEGTFTEEPRTLVASDGRTIPTVLRARPLRDADGRVWGTLAVYVDLTERLRAEESLARLHAAVENAGEMILLTDPQGRITYVNPAFESASGWSREEAVGQTVVALLGPSEPLETDQETMWRTLAQGGTWKGSFVHRQKGGGRFEVEATISPIRGRGGRVKGYVAIERDVTRERRLERTLRRARRLETLGQLAGAVAHDFNNFLTVILGQAEILEAEPELPTGAKDRVDRIREAAEGAAALTSQLLAFGRRQPMHPQVVGLNDLVRSHQKMVRKLVGEAVRVKVVLDPSAGWVRVDPTRFAQVLLNLAANARDAMPGGGTLSIRTGRSQDEEGPALAVLTVADTGIGMDEETRARIFEPFFTTKGPDRGTGLGLATVYGIVAQAGGCIEVETAPGQGARFEIRLPAVDEAAPELGGPEIPSRDVPRGEGEKILLVDDDPAVGQVAAETLEGLGYRVVRADGPGEALLTAEQEGWEIDLLLTDVRMPLMDGVTLASRLSERMPGLAVVFMSGHTGGQDLKPGAMFVSKPFRSVDLARAVRRALQGSQESPLEPAPLTAPPET
ncbi:MAG: PAS domain S-box protein [Deltaproteobacteria bacterium]|nr:PAS domain S-box protein [Deltaproteobacteria bacterium]